MTRPFAVFDIDGTLIRWQLYHAVVEAIAKPSPHTLSTIKEVRKQWKTRTDKDSFKKYEAELVRIFESLLAELSPEDFAKAIGSTFEEYKDQVYTYTRDLIKDLKQKNYLLFAISGSHAEIVEQLAKYYGFDDFVGTRYEQKSGHFTGKVKVGKYDKHLALQNLVEKHSATFVGSMGVGDSKSDAAFLEIVEQPIAFNPDHELFKIAQEKKWKIVVERKNIIYQLEPRDGTYVLAETN
jgi:HAD superfamily hydrolase (TIGR01490 family)